MTGPSFATRDFKDAVAAFALTYLEEIEGVSAPFLAQCPDADCLGYNLAKSAAEPLVVALIDRLDGAGAAILLGFGLALGSLAAQSSDGTVSGARTTLLQGFKLGVQMTVEARRRRAGQ